MASLVGAWRLRSAYFVARGTGARLDILGAEPFGYVVFEPSGRVIALLTAGVGARAAAADAAGLRRPGRRGPPPRPSESGFRKV